MVWYGFGVVLRRGQHLNAIDLCMKAGSLLSSSSHVVYGCLGVASQYLNRNMDAVRYFRASRELLRARTYVDPLPFIGMSMNAGDVEFNLLQALNVNGEFDACTDAGLEMMGLPKPALGGATILAFSFVDWSVDKIVEINNYGKEESSAGRLTLPKKTRLYDEVSVNTFPSAMPVLEDGEHMRSAFHTTRRYE